MPPRPSGVVVEQERATGHPKRPLSRRNVVRRNVEIRATALVERRSNTGEWWKLGRLLG
jgi:hypothetical protein